MVPKKAAERLNRSSTTIRHWIRTGLIKAKRVDQKHGGYYYDIPSSEVERLKRNPPKRGRPSNP